MTSKPAIEFCFWGNDRLADAVAWALAAQA